MKQKWDGNVRRIKDNRWTIKCAKWAPQGKRKRGRPRRRCAEQMTFPNTKATSLPNCTPRGMERAGGWLYPAVD